VHERAWPCSGPGLAALSQEEPAATHGEEFVAPPGKGPLTDRVGEEKAGAQMSVCPSALVML